MNEIFEAVRKAATPRNWSRGVELARAGVIEGEREDESEIALRVVGEGGLSSHAVTLDLENAEWECTCAGAEDPCEHVTGAVIALRQTRAEGKRLPKPATTTGRIGYRLLRQNGALALERVVVIGNREVALTTTLVAVAKGRVDGPSFVATQADLLAERALGSRLRGVLPRETMTALLAALGDESDVRLEGEPVRVSATPVVPEGRLEDQGSGFRLFVELEAGVRERFTNGLVLVGDTLRPVGQTKLTARELEEFARGVHFPPDEAARLVTEVLPSLVDRIPFEVRTKRLPKTREEPPRIILDVRREKDELVVFPTLVYGDPPRARVDSGRLVLLGGAVPLRDARSEQRLTRQVQAQLGLLFGREERFRGAEAVRVASRLETFDGEVRGRGADSFFLAPALAPRLERRGDDAWVTFESQGNRGGAAFRGNADPETVIGAWRRGEALVPLLDGGFAPVPHEWLEAHGDAVADLLAAREGSGKTPPAAIADLARLCESLGEAPPPGFERLRALVGAVDEIPPPDLPGDLRAELRAYQRQGVAWLSFLRDAGLGALLADDMGLGKTLQALSTFRARTSGSPQGTLVVCPTSVLVAWAEEIERFRPGLRVATYHGPKRALDPAADVTLTTYAILRLDADRLAEETWSTVVLDETQMIKNPESQVAQAAYRLRGDFRLALSGTPVENRLDELWSQFRFLNPGWLGSRADFDERYVRPIAAGTPAVAERLRRRIRPFVLRRLKREVAPELPPRIEVVLRCELDESERNAYLTVLAAAREEVAGKLSAGGGVLAALEALLRLRQACCHPGLLPGRSAESSSKVALLLEELETAVAEGHKALVFSQWTGLLDLVEPHLRERRVAFSRLDGATRDRAAVVQAFQQEDGPPVMLVSLKAGGTGLTLTAADHVFLLDPWWNPAVEDQAADRAHRIGQTRSVIVHRLVAADTVEERILALQGEKRKIAEAALGGEGQASSISRDDLLALLG